jgi:hypothetical protein
MTAVETAGVRSSTEQPTASATANPHDTLLVGKAIGTFYHSVDPVGQ